MLCLVGSGEFLPPIELIDSALLERLPGSARVVCLPTASGSEGAVRVQYWMDLGIQHYNKMGVYVEAVPVIDKQSANDPAHVETVARANFVFFSGGSPYYLYKTLENSLVWQAVLQIHERGGIVAGCSAGAMILGKGFPGFPRWQKGFALLPDVVIVPHFDEMGQFFVRGMHRLIRRGNIVLGIDGSTGLLVDGQLKTVLGRGAVTVLGAGFSERFTAGQDVDWNRD